MSINATFTKSILQSNLIYYESAT